MIFYKSNIFLVFFLFYFQQYYLNQYLNFLKSYLVFFLIVFDYVLFHVLHLVFHTFLLHQLLIIFVCFVSKVEKVILEMRAFDIDHQSRAVWSSFFFSFWLILRKKMFDNLRLFSMAS